MQENNWNNLETTGQSFLKMLDLLSYLIIICSKTETIDRAGEIL